MDKELIDKLVGSKVTLSKTGESVTVTEIVDSDNFDNVIMVCDNGKRCGLKFVFEKGIVKFDKEFECLIKEEINLDTINKETKSDLEDKERIEKRRERKNRVNIPHYFTPEDCIASFRGEYYFLSNFFDAPVTYKGLTFLNNEAAFQGQKDLSRTQEFVGLTNGRAKKLGRQVKLRPDWEEVKLGIMEEIVRCKFTQNEELKQLLINTGDKLLIEGNGWNDTYWGVSHGRGENHLGMILMKIRKELIEGSK